jgi:hypothetical protein
VEFRASAEVYQPAFSALDRVRRNIGPFLNAAFARCSLAALECKLRYVPIVMPENMQGRYPARSKLRKKERLYDCAPVLNYETFVNGTFEDQLGEYVKGIALCVPYLAALGASSQQIDDFKAILAGAVERILLEQPGQTRH